MRSGTGNSDSVIVGVPIPTKSARLIITNLPKFLGMNRQRQRPKIKSSLFALLVLHHQRRDDLYDVLLLTTREEERLVGVRASCAIRMREVEESICIDLE